MEALSHTIESRRMAGQGLHTGRRLQYHSCAGFVLDERGVKMSKSIGNVVDPRVVMEGGKDAKVHPPPSSRPSFPCRTHLLFAVSCGMQQSMQDPIRHAVL